MTSFLRGSCPHLRHPGPVNFPRARSRGRRVPLHVALAPQAHVGVPVRRANLENEPTRRPSLGVHVHTSRRVTGAAALSGPLWSHAEHPATADYPRWVCQIRRKTQGDGSREVGVAHDTSGSPAALVSPSTRVPSQSAERRVAGPARASAMFADSAGGGPNPTG
jgi:hypothetical protein